MRKKLNYLIWGFVIVLIIFFITLTIVNNNKIKEFKFTTIKPYNVDVRVYLKDKNKGNELSEKIQKVKILEDSHDYINLLDTNLELKKILDNNKIDKYLIQADDDVLVGNYYGDGKYKVATYYKDNSLFKIFEVENKLILTEDYVNEEYDRIIMVGQLEQVLKMNNTFKKLEILEDQKKIIKEINNIEVYWLKENRVIDSLKNK